ncbi:probable inactive 1-aminocyclopropane-1-carboxylate synthase-like protein 2 isoform X2 [Lingula anatina]|nr:probable inactive 1-aminocyclopropane-1-carboxylate synthase-like protein 2 isoform X2 [Lingula anatina]|eukprot:XP_013398602.1 probable inactive 1-aminocyclopropane-1-carboxylate synthase-like protein 2 isoform X2 [Lingula anatina]
MHVVTPDMLYYFNYIGEKSFRNAIAEFITERFHTRKPVDPDDVLVINGCGTALEQLPAAVADPGDFFLCPSPVYSSVHANAELRMKVKCFDVPLKSKASDAAIRPFQLTLAQIEGSYNEAIKLGLKVKGIFLINPCNPTGEICSRDLLTEILNFAKSRCLHVIVDEIYALSVFDSEARFHSVLSLPDLPDPQRTHVLWGFSKDFSLSGFRCGVVVTQNVHIKAHLNNVAYYQCTPPILQNMLRIMLSDKEWLDRTYFPTKLKLTREGFASAVKELSDVGVKCHPSQAAFFLWADFSAFLSSSDRDGEMELFQRFLSAGVYVVPGTSMFCTEPGWFRITFTLPKPYFQEGLRRIKTILNESRQHRPKPPNI